MIIIINIIIFIIFLVVLFINYSDTIFNVDFWKIAGPIISAIVAVINLLFVFSLTTYDRKRKTKTEKLDQISFWFRKIILEENIEQIHETFNHVTERLDSTIKSEEIIADEKFKIFIGKFLINKRKLIAVLNDQIRIIDEVFAEKLDEKLDDFEDLLTEEVEDLFTCPNEELNSKVSSLENLVSKSRKIYLKLLFDFERAGYKYVEDIEKDEKIFKRFWKWLLRN